MNILEAYDVLEEALSVLGSYDATCYTDQMRENALDALNVIYEVACMND